MLSVRGVSKRAFWARPCASSRASVRVRRHRYLNHARRSTATRPPAICEVSNHGLQIDKCLAERGRRQDVLQRFSLDVGCRPSVDAVDKEEGAARRQLAVLVCSVAWHRSGIVGGSQRGAALRARQLPEPDPNGPQPPPSRPRGAGRWSPVWFGHFGLGSAVLYQFRADAGHVWAESGKIGAAFDQIGAASGQSGTDMGQVWTNFDKV